MKESELIELCRQGDQDARRQLYEQTSAQIYRLLFKMTKNHEDAMDLAQATYIRVFQAIGRFEGTARLATWVYRIAINEGLQFLRQRRRRHPAVDNAADAAEVRLERLPATEDCVTPGPCDELRLDLEAALAQLPNEDRLLIHLRYYDGLSYTEIAETLDSPAGTIASRLNRARQKLRGLLETSPDTQEKQAPGHQIQ